MRIPTKVLGIILLTQTFLCQLAYGNPQDSLRPLPQINKEFLVVVHVVKSTLKGDLGIDTNSIKSAIPSINSYFAPIGASFKVCEIRVIDNLKFDSINKAVKERDEVLNLHHVPERLNVYYVSHLIHYDGRVICGDGAVGGIAKNNGGIFLVKGCSPTYVIAHEMGHYMGLPHTFEGHGTEHANGSNCETEGDGVCDTPADPYTESMPSIYTDGNCKFTYEGRDANGDFYDPLMSNIMNYYGCGCGTFTHGQYTKMANTYLLSNPKVDW